MALLTVVVLLSASAAHGAQMEYDIEDYNRLSTLNTPELMERGRQFLQGRMMVDSALVCYSIVSSREHDKKLNREMMHLVDSALVCYAVVSSREGKAKNRDEQKQIVKAYNNLGFIYAAYYYDYQKAYENVDHSLELCKQYGFEDNLAYGYLNLASILDSRNDLYGDDAMSTEALENNKLAFDYAVKVQEWNVAVTSIFNMLNMMREKDDIQLIKPELDHFKSLALNDSVEMLQCTRMFCEGLEAYFDGHYSQALKCYEQMEVEAQRLMTNRQQCIIKAVQQKSMVLLALKRYDDAFACLQQIEKIAQEQKLQSELIDVYRSMTHFYSATGNQQLAAKFEYKYLKARDEFIHKSHVEKLEKSRFLNEMRRVNEQVEEIQAKHERAHQLLLMMSMIAAIILVALVLLVRSYIKQRNYIRHLYEKNVQLLDQPETVHHPIPHEAETQEETVPKYQGMLDQESKDRLFDQIKQVMDDVSIICQPDFSLQQLAEHVGSNYKYVSQVVNECYGKSFKQVLNEQRVREACRILNDTDQSSHLTIEAIAADLGFNSRSNFTVTFKRITGISPSDFMKMAKEK